MIKKTISESQVLENLGIEKLNDMQIAAIAAFEKESDIVLISPTGTGKTLGFLLPLFQSFDNSAINIQAVILVPARELAIQIESVFKQMSTGFKVNCCYGGHSITTEINNLSVPPALLIGTPGRINDLIGKGHLNLKNVSTIILDEFDKSLELGFQEDMTKIMSQMPAIQKRFLTSATKMKKIPEFVGMKEVHKLNFTKSDTTELQLEIKKVFSDSTEKLPALLKLICKLGNQSILVFLNHRDAVERVSDFLNDEGIIHGFYHGGLQQKDRERALTKFRNGSVKILVTTDLASRGLDIPEIESIVHYHLPLTEEAYTHRNGRTARMHSSGKVFVITTQEDKLPDFIDTNLPIEKLPEIINLPEKPEWVTIYISKGKKEKINKIDIVGFLIKKGHLKKDELGLIEVKDLLSYAAVKRDKVYELLKKLKNEKIKNRSIKVTIAR